MSASTSCLGQGRTKGPAVMTEPHPIRLAITGASGFVGGHFLRFLNELEAGPSEILALALDTPPRPVGQEKWAVCDLTNRPALQTLFQRFRPTAVLHLAAVVTGNDLSAFFDANMRSAENLLSVSASLEPMPRIVLVGSAAQYGAPPAGITKIREDHPLAGETPYGISKVFQEKWAAQYQAAKNLPVVYARPFNLLGPGQSAYLVPGAFLQQIKDYLDGRTACIEVGNLQSYRDFIDVRDMARALWSLICAGPEIHGEAFNISSGKGTRIQELLETCVHIGGGRIPVKSAAGRLKDQEISVVTGDPSKIRAATGWHCSIPLETSLRDMWDHLTGASKGCQ